MTKTMLSLKLKFRNSSKIERDNAVWGDVSMKNL